MIPFDFQFQPRIVFGPDKIDSLGELAGQLGVGRALVVSDPGVIAAGHTQRGLESLKQAGIDTLLLATSTKIPRPKTWTRVSSMLGDIRRI